MISPFAQLKPGESYTWRYDWYACCVGGSSKIVDCTAVGVTCQAFTARRAGTKLQIGGRFGVFFAGSAKAVFFDEDRHRCGAADLGPVSPRQPFLPSTECAVPAAARRMALVVYSASGKELGELSSAVPP
jgi:hypothetical protein